MKFTGNAKSRLNLSIDIVMFILLVSMAGIGFLMKYVVVTGEVRNIIYGNNINLQFFGLTRHQWGSIHLIISISFLAMLVLHIIFHWKWIVTIYKCLFPNRYFRYGSAGLLCLFASVILISPFFLEPEKVPLAPKYRNRLNNVTPGDDKHAETVGKELITEEPVTGRTESLTGIQKIPAATNREDHHNEEYGEYEVYGYNTLQYAADRYNVPVAVITRDLNIPENLAGERLSWLRKQYGFSMTDVRKSISGYKKHNK